MSTSVIQPGTTRSAGPSGRFIGLAAAGLAAVIALGFVFASNQTNEVTESEADLQVSQASDDAWNARIEFLTEQHAARADAAAFTRLMVLNAGNDYTAPAVQQNALPSDYRKLMDSVEVPASNVNALPSDYRKLMDIVEVPVAQQNALPSDWRKQMDIVEVTSGAATAADTAPDRLPREKGPR